MMCMGKAKGEHCLSLVFTGLRWFHSPYPAWCGWVFLSPWVLIKAYFCLCMSPIFMTRLWNVEILSPVVLVIPLFRSSPVSSEILWLCTFFFYYYAVFSDCFHVILLILWQRTPQISSTVLALLFRLSMLCPWVPDEEKTWTYPRMLLYTVVIHCGEPRVRGKVNSSERTYIYMWKAGYMPIPHPRPSITQILQFSLLWV